MAKSGSLYCLGDIVHNSNEVERLQRKGLVTITHDDLRRLHGVKVLLRAHGEPPETYRIARENGIEIIDATFEIEEGSFIAIPFDATELLGKDELIDHQNQLVSFKGLTVEKVAYKNDQPGDDIYVTFGYNGASYDFCVESYLTGPDTEVYSTVGALKEGDVVDVEGFLYWYEGVNTHITAVTVAQ